MTAALHAEITEFRYLGAAKPALTEISLRVDPGEFIVITGAAGSGKSTLCYCLTGVIPRSIQGACFVGRISAGGQDLTGLSLPQISRHVGFVMQEPENQLFQLTVAEDVAFGPENLGLPAAEVQARVHKYLQFTGTERLHRRFSHLLSGGQSQRVVLSAMLALEAGVYVLDQPAGELDPAGRAQIYENLHRLNREAGKTILVVEDRLSDVAHFATRILLLDQGRIIRDLPPREFFADPAVAGFGVRIPDAVQLAHALAAEGLPLPSLPLTAAEAVAQIQESLPEQIAPLTVAPSPVTPGPDSAAAIEIGGLVHRYPGGFEALAGIDLTVRKGEFVAIIGENGAGKSTLAKHLVGLLRPSAGGIRICGEPIAKLSIHQIARHVGFLFQDPDLQIFNNSCAEEVAYGLKLRGVPAENARESAVQTLARLGLAAYQDEHPYTLSRGQRQRLAVASVLALRPPVLVVDEPSTGLDLRESRAMMQLLDEYRRDGGTVLIITHDMGIATECAQRIVAMANGKIMLDVPADRIQEHIGALEGTAVLLPDLAVIAHKLGLPPGLRTLPQVVEVLAMEEALNRLDRREVTGGV